MALWRYRRRLEAAALGELTGAEELALFTHLRQCAACRTHYELLARTAEVLSPARAASREQARLFAAMQPAAAVAGAPSRLRWFVAAASVAAAVTLFAWPSAKQPEDEVVLRGGPADAVPAAALLIYARGVDGTVHLAADFPLSGRVKLSRAQEVQLFVRHPWAGAHVTARATSAEGTVMALADMDVGEAGAHSVGLGQAFALSRLAAGTWRVAAVVAPLGLDAGTLLEVSGTLEVIEP